VRRSDLRGILPRVFTPFPREHPPRYSGPIPRRDPIQCPRAESSEGQGRPSTSTAFVTTDTVCPCARSVGRCIDLFIACLYPRVRYSSSLAKKSWCDARTQTRSGSLVILLPYLSFSHSSSRSRWGSGGHIEGYGGTYGCRFVSPSTHQRWKRILGYQHYQQVEEPHPATVLT
jgi:hypothetical protein